MGCACWKGEAYDWGRNVRGYQIWKEEKKMLEEKDQ